MTSQFNNRIRQVILLAVIILMGYLIVRELYLFLPGFMGAVTFYILGRGTYMRMVDRMRWKPSLSALSLILLFLLLIALPIYYAFTLVAPRLSSVFSHTEELFTGVRALTGKVKEITGTDLLTPERLQQFQKGLADYIPTFLNSGANILSNVIMMFFILYFMFVQCKPMEQGIRSFLPLSEASINALTRETTRMVRANAIGIPLISIIQGITAMVGYVIFGLKDWPMWGFLTGVFAFFPIVGTMIVWVPLVIFLYASGQNWQGTGLLVYSLAVTGNVDYIARITLMRRIGDVHPLITILGVIVGLQLFGFMGFIFGPLLFSYVIILVRIYTFEFVTHSKKELDDGSTVSS